MQLIENPLALALHVVVVRIACAKVIEMSLPLLSGISHPAFVESAPLATALALGIAVHLLALHVVSAFFLLAALPFRRSVLVPAIADVLVHAVRTLVV